MYINKISYAAQHNIFGGCCGQERHATERVTSFVAAPLPLPALLVAEAGVCMFSNFNKGCPSTNIGKTKSICFCFTLDFLVHTHILVCSREYEMMM